MKRKNMALRKVILLGAAMMSAFLAADLLVGNSGPEGGIAAGSHRPIFLAKPAFAQGIDTSFLDAEAGIAAYTNVGGPISLGSARPAFRTIEDETDQYIVGSVPLPDYAETEDVHVFVHVDGWIVSYYLRDEPAAKIVDWQDYDGADIRGTKLEDGVTVVSTAIGIPATEHQYYHFKYPNANRLTIVAEAVWEDQGEDTFRLKLPSGLAFYERSYSHYAYGQWGVASDLYLDDERISDFHYGSEHTGYGLLSPSQLPADQFRTMKVTEAYNTEKAFAAIVLVYLET